MRTSQIVLKATDKAALWAALEAAGITVEGEDGPAVAGYSFNEVGIVQAPTGNMLEQDGFDFEETAPVDGWFAVLCGKLGVDLVAALADITVTEWPASVPTYSLPEPTPAEIAAEAKAHADAIKAECSARILAVADERTQGNIAQAGVIYLSLRDTGMSVDDARAAASLKDGDLERAAHWKQWVTQMQDHCRALITGTTTDDWPAVPAGVVDLAKRF